MQITPADRALIAPGDTLRVAIAVGPARSAIWAGRDAATGKPAGVTVDLAHALGERLGLPVALAEYDSSGKIIEAAASGSWDIGFTPVDAERKKHVLFGPDYFLGESTYMVRAGLDANTLAEIDRPGIRILGVENTATLRSARRTLAHAKADGVAGLEEAATLFAQGRVDALALGRESLVSLLPRFPGARMLAEAFHAAGVAIAVPLDRAAALEIASTALEALKADGTVRRIFDRNGMQDAAVAPAGSRS